MGINASCASYPNLKQKKVHLTKKDRIIRLSSPLAPIPQNQLLQSGSQEDILSAFIFFFFPLDTTFASLRGVLVSQRVIRVDRAVSGTGGRDREA